jgi:transposase
VVKEPDIFRVRQSSIDTYLSLLDELWNSGCRNGAELWRRRQTKGFRGALRVVNEWATRRRRAERVSDQQPQKVPSGRKITRLMTAARDHLSKADSVVIAAIKAGAPMLVKARGLIDRFHAMIRKKTEADLEPWIADADTRLLASFAWAFAGTMPLSERQLLSPGQTVRPKGRSQSSNW